MSGGESVLDTVNVRQSPYKQVVDCATTGPMPAYTMSDGPGPGRTMTINAAGAFGTIDGVAIAAGTTVLIKDETMPFNAVNNGVYVCTNPGAVGVQPVFVRPAWFDSDEEVFRGAEIRVAGGTVHAARIFSLFLFAGVDSAAMLFQYDSGAAIAIANNVAVINAQQKDVAVSGAMPGWHVAFVQLLAEGQLAIRTYEYGVEAETLACGTGSASAAILAARRFAWPAEYTNNEKPVKLTTRSGDVVRVYVGIDDDDRVTDLCLETLVRCSYSATLCPDLASLALKPVI